MAQVAAAMLVKLQIIVPPTELRPDLDLLGYPLTPGCRVRAFNQAIAAEDGRVFGFDLEGERADYIEGTLTRIGDVIHGSHRCYAIAGTRAVEGESAREIRQSVFPPVNGTPTSADRITCGVVRIVPAAKRCKTLSDAVLQMHDRVHDGLYSLTPDSPGTEKDRADLGLQRDLETTFGFVDEPGIPGSVRVKAYDLARRQALASHGRFAPIAIVTEYAELAEILRIGQRTPIEIEPR